MCHMLMSSYGWTIEEVENITMPEALDLIKIISKYPPINVFAVQMLKAFISDKEQMDINKLVNMQEHMNPSIVKAKYAFKNSGNKILKMVRKRSNQRII